MLDFIRFPTPLNAQSFASHLVDITEKWNLRGKKRAVITENASDISAGMKIVHERLGISAQGIELADFHVRCLAHIINLGVKDSLRLIHEGGGLGALINKRYKIITKTQRYV